MTPGIFERPAALVIQEKAMKMQEPIFTVNQRLLATLLYLTTGYAYTQL